MKEARSARRKFHATTIAFQEQLTNDNAVDVTVMEGAINDVLMPTAAAACAMCGKVRH